MTDRVLICGSDGAPKCTCGADATTPLGMHRDHCAARRWSHGRCPCCGDKPQDGHTYCRACIANVCPDDDEAQTWGQDTQAWAEATAPAAQEAWAAADLDAVVAREIGGLGGRGRGEVAG